MIRRMLGVIAVTGVALALALIPNGVASANVPGEVSAIWNNGTVNLGVDHVYDFSYAAGPYDGLLAPGQRTDDKWAWGRAEAFYLAAGECATVATRPINNSSAPWSYFGKIGPFGGAVSQATTDGYLWQVKRYLLGSCPGSVSNFTAGPEQDSASSAPTPLTPEQTANLAKRVPRDQIPAPHLTAEIRPYGAELYTRTEADGTTNSNFCSTAYNALSASGGQYVLSAGHCTRDVDPLTGKFFYPKDTANLIGDNGSRFRFDSGGDFAAIRANRVTGTLVRKIRQPANGRVDTMNNAGNPVLGNDAALLGGNSRQVYKGFFSFTNECLHWDADGVHPAADVCNLALIQAPRAAPTGTSPDGCVIGGDSGSPSETGLVFNGVLHASAIDATHCFMWVTQAANAMTAFGLHSAPATG